MTRVSRIVSACTGVLLILLAASIFIASQSFLDRLDLLHSVPPICLPLDLSAKGVYSGCYRRSFHAVLDDQLRLVVAGSPSEEETKKALSGLSALMVLRNDSGRVLSQQVVVAADFHEWSEFQKSGLVLTLPMEEAGHRAGTYELSIEVKTPAKGMAGHPHCIVAELGLCNAEGIGVYAFCLPAGWAALFVGVIILLVRTRKRTQEHTKNNEGESHRS